MTEAECIDLAVLVESLQKLLNDPRPGLFTWTIAVLERCKAIGEYAQ